MAQLEHITPDQIAQYGVVAAPDRLTGRAQDNKAIFDRLVRELVALVVNDIIDRTNELLIAEDTREENEADRIAAENLRVQAENLRVQAENIRVENEQSRVQAEASRVAAELLRVQAESLRVSAEQSRVSAEAEREAAEALRESTTSGIVVRATEQAEAAERSATRALNAEQGASNYERAAGESAANAAAFSQNAKNFASDAESSSADAEASAIAAAESVKRSPYIDPNKKTWFVWDSNTGAFVDTGIVAEGQSGIEADGLWGVYVDEEGFLVVTYTGDDPPPLSISDDGYLVYTLNGQEIRVGKTVGPEGPAGPQGSQGPAGAAGQSAYEAAQAGGYAGTQQEFYSDLAQLKDGPFLPQSGGRVTTLSIQGLNLHNEPVDWDGTGSAIQDTAFLEANGPLIVYGTEKVRIGSMDSQNPAGLSGFEFSPGSVSLTEDLNAAGSGITNLKPPSANRDAATKEYVDQAVSGGSGADGGYYIPFVEENGDLSWTATKLDMPDVPVVNIMGKPGKTPVRGTDYWTEADKEEIVTEVLEQVDPGGGGGSYVLPAATADALGGVKADPATDTDTQPVRIGQDNKLYTAPGGGGEGSEMEFINSMTLDQAVTSGRIDVDTTGQPFVLSEAIATVKLPKGEMLNNPVYYWYFTADTKFYINQSIGNGNDFSLIAEGNASIGYIKLYYTSVYSGTPGIYASLVEVNQNITMFRFANFDGVPLPAGTAISLYGKRKAV